VVALTAFSGRRILATVGTEEAREGMDAVYVVGAGGIGCTLGVALINAGVPVTFVESNPRKVAAGRREGVEVVGLGRRPARFLPFKEWSPPAGATVLLTTKCYDNATVLSRLPRQIELVPVQNGFDPLLASHGHAREGIASFVSECDPERPRTRITRPGTLHLGWRTASGIGVRESPSPLDALKTSRLFRVVRVAGIEPYKFAKLMYNAAISPVAAAAGVDNGQLLGVPALRRLFFALLSENARILRAAGVRLGRVGPISPYAAAWILQRPWLANRLARVFEPSLRGTYCSMAGEVATGRTELDYYNGHLIRLAREVGAACPLNQAVYDQVNQMAQAHRPPSSTVWQGLMAARAEPSGAWRSSAWPRNQDPGAEDPRLPSCSAV
jgi:2-dehydropantoate 2-reductase